MRKKEAATILWRTTFYRQPVLLARLIGTTKKKHEEKWRASDPFVECEIWLVIIGWRGPMRRRDKRLHNESVLQCLRNEKKKRIVLGEWVPGTRSLVGQRKPNWIAGVVCAAAIDNKIINVWAFSVTVTHCFCLAFAFAVNQFWN